MWLIELDDNGLVKESSDSDGWRGIKEFRVIEKKYGREGLTVIALSTDYLSPFMNYGDEERLKRCQEEVYGIRDKLNFTKDKDLKEAVRKYKELQFNVQMQRSILNDEIERTLTRQLSEAYESNDDDEINRINLRLSKHDEAKKKFMDDFDKKSVISDYSVTANGYKLTRIEMDIAMRRNSKFTNAGSMLKNPDILGLDAEPLK